MSVNRAMLAKIHIAKKELGLSDDVYRDILQTRYKKDSAARLTSFEADDLVGHFKSQGFRVKQAVRPSSIPGASGMVPSMASKGKRPKPEGFKSSPTYDKPMARKVVALWINLALAGTIRYSSDAALQSYVKRMTGVDNLAWCDDRQLYSLIEALKKWAKREGVKLDE